MQLATLTGHTFRVLYLAISPDGQVMGSCLTFSISPSSTISTANKLVVDSLVHFSLPLSIQTIVTGAGDETLRFWTVFPSPKSQVKFICICDAYKYNGIASQLKRSV